MESKMQMQTYYDLAYNHIVSQHERNPCSLCGAMIGKKMMARHFQSRHTAAMDRKYKCNLCSKAFMDNQKLKDHTNTHTGEKPYLCKFCGKGFASLGTHRMHEKSHMGYKRKK